MDSVGLPEAGEGHLKAEQRRLGVLDLPQGLGVGDDLGERYAGGVAYRTLEFGQGAGEDRLGRGQFPAHARPL